jgi:alpha-mannosidase
VTRVAGDLSAQVAAALAVSDPAVGHALCFYGVGDHGGGPTKANVEWIRDARIDGAELRFSTPEAFFAAIGERRDLLPVVDAELQHCFPGCYSVMHDVKAAQRHGERALTAAQAVVERFSDAPGPLHARLDAAWEDLLFCQFHDVLSGTSVPSAWDAIRAMQGRARIAGEEVVVEATRRRALALGPAPFRRIVLMHAGEDPWEGVVEAEPFLDFDSWGERWLSERDGTPIPFQRVQPDAQALTSRVLFGVALAPGEVREVLVREDAPRPATPPADLECTSERLANARLAVDLATGAVTLDGARVLEGFDLHLRHETSDTWTWDTDAFTEPVATVLAPGAWAVEEAGPLRARVRREARLGEARLRLTLTLESQRPVLGLGLEVLWGERFKALQLLLRLPEAPAEWTDGLPGGRVRRSPGATEWPVCGWSRVGPLALVTHDAYSLSVHDRAWQWTLLRSPKMAWGGGRPDPYGGRDVHSDQGEHSFAFELVPAGELDPEARARRIAPVAFERAEGVDRPPAAIASGAHVPVLFAHREPHDPDPS